MDHTEEPLDDDCGVIHLHGVTVTDFPMGGCSTSSAHNAHLTAGSPVCENQRDA